LATKYEAAGDKAQFLAGVSKAFGERIGPQLIEVFQRLNTEGLDKFKESAAGAAEGMSELAKASDNLEKAGDKATIWAGKVVGAILRVAPAVERFVQAGGVSGWMARRRRTGPMFGEGEGGHEGGQAAADADTSKADALAEFDAEEREKRLEAEMTAEEKRIAQRYEAIEAMKREDAATKKLADSRRKLEEQKLEIFSDAQKDIADAKAGKGIAIPGMARVDSLQSIGGLVGGAAGRGDQSARIAEKQASIQEAIRDIVAEHTRKLDAIDKKLGELGDA
jgi:hypothetical protein